MSTPQTADGDAAESPSDMTLRARFDRVDREIARQMDRLGIPTLRVALGIVFIWFGGLKVIGGSPAAELVASTVYVVPAELFVPILGVWEVLIGLCLLYRPLIRVGILLLFLQMPGTFLPIVLLPEQVFFTFPHELTVEGQYIIKNLVIIGAALVVGGTVRGGNEDAPDETEPTVSERDSGDAADDTDPDDTDPDAANDTGSAATEAPAEPESPTGYGPDSGKP
ncbi:putative membrane protein YkgB [Halorubrum alkaliphilum]|uniref:Putative membrane protein YkgB n=1 Tax=Halorubrum alkaliphilum TaxID=261290 RepID=A0A8T4GHA6_9EURY|nr:DoxX family protein [Halorubrum alkaliphilum]MBP1923606.1 putative membrane protein YkgB [Halorubrum alkaliphilum]